MQNLLQLDLNRHAPEDFSGKYFSLHGADYILGDLIGEGGEAFVHPMRNARSGISWFVAKIYKFLPNSLEYEERRKDNGLHFSSFIMDLHGDIALYTEIHEIPGGLMRLQRNMSHRSDPDSYDQLMIAAGELAKRQDWQQATDTYLNIIKNNPNHTPALLNLSTCLLHQNNVGEALKHLQHALSVEPNDTQIYHQIANIFADLGSPEAALNILDLTLKRYRWDVATWKLKGSIACRYSNDTLIGDMISELKSLPVRADDKMIIMSTIVATLQDGIREAAERNVLKSTAGEHQEREEWKSALDTWKQIGREHWDLIDQLNFAICSFNLGAYQDAVTYSLRVAASNQVATETAIGLGLLASIRGSFWQQARMLALHLENSIESLIDLPSLPQRAFAGGAILESPSTIVYEQLLAVLLSETTNPIERSTIHRLISRYRERNQIIQDNQDKSQEERRKPWWKFW